jgi:hypothetical protein
MFLHQDLIKAIQSPEWQPVIYLKTCFLDYVAAVKLMYLRMSPLAIFGAILENIRGYCSTLKRLKGNQRE